MFTAFHLSSLSCRFGASAFSLRPSQVSITGFVACVGFRTLASARLLAVYAAPRLPRVCGGVRVRHKAGKFWVSVPVSSQSLPVEVQQGSAVCSVGSPSDVRWAMAGSGRV